jgi:hypothetical protein
MGLLLGLTELADAEGSGITYRGDPAVLERLRTGSTAAFSAS